jgi:pimeloyl-ACP methyl ester carboxylesterase
MPYFTHGGRRLYYRERGAGAPLLILPGNTASSACHAGELEHFGARYRAAALDLPGTGLSERLEDWPRDWWAAGAAAAAGLIEHLGEGPAVVVGTSGGAAVALLLAIGWPERVRAVVADSVVARIPPAPLRALLAGRAERSAGQEAFWRAAHGDDWAHVVDADTAMLASFLGTGIDYFGGRLGQVGCPALLIASLADPLLPDVGPQLLAMAQAIPRSRLFLASAGDHPLMWSRPAEFRAVADAFLSSCL